MVHDHTSGWSTQMFHSWWVENLDRENSSFKAPKESDVRKAREMRKYWSRSGLMTTSSREFFKNPVDHYPGANADLPEIFREGTNREKVWVRGRDHVMNNKSSSIRTMLEPTSMAKKFIEEEKMRLDVNELISEIKERSSSVAAEARCKSGEQRSHSCASRNTGSTRTSSLPSRGSKHHVRSGPLPSLPGRPASGNGSLSKCSSALALPNVPGSTSAKVPARRTQA